MINLLIFTVRGVVGIFSILVCVASEDVSVTSYSPGSSVIPPSAIARDVNVYVGFAAPESLLVNVRVTSSGNL